MLGWIRRLFHRSQRRELPEAIRLHTVEPHTAGREYAYAVAAIDNRVLPHYHPEGCCTPPCDTQHPTDRDAINAAMHAPAPAGTHKNRRSGLVRTVRVAEGRAPHARRRRLPKFW